MSVYPQILAGYEAVRDLATDRVTVKDPHNIGRIPSDPLEMMASFPAAYTVELVPLRDGINVCPWGRYGFPEGDMQLVPYGIDHIEPGFPAAIQGAVRPVIDEQLARLDKVRDADHKAAKPGEVFESRDAIRRIH
jgi:hypothetical protein